MCLKIIYTCRTHRNFCPGITDLGHKPKAERALANFDHPDSLDTELMISHIQSLKKGASIEVPTYCFETHCRTDEIKREEAKRIIIVEGILILTHPALRNELDLKVFVVSAKDRGREWSVLDNLTHVDVRTRIRMCD